MAKGSGGTRTSGPKGSASKAIIETNAAWFDSGTSADETLREESGKAWISMSSEQRDAFEAYTGDDYAAMNRIMREDTPSTTPYIDDLKEQIEEIAAAIGKTSLKKAISVQRVEGISGLKKFGVDPKSINSDTIKNLVGRTGTEKAFTSTCVVRGAAQKMDGNFDVVYNIRLPKGAKAIYTEPFSTYGSGAGRSWDGKSKQKQIGSEAELLIQRGAKYRITGARKAADGFYHIDMDLIK